MNGDLKTGLSVSYLPSMDMRDAFFAAIYQLAEKDRGVIFLTDDMDALGLQRFRKDFPERFINVGVAEQNMINVAAGLALCGKKVFAYGIASFVTFRSYEQIRVNICSMNLPVTLIGVGAGFSFGFDGPTHHGIHDVAVMRTLPEMTIWNPSDAFSAAALAQLSYEDQTPSFIRLDKGVFPSLFDPAHDFKTGFHILKSLQQTNIITTGYMTQRALELVREFSNRSIPVGLVDLYRLKPIHDDFYQQVLRNSEQIVTLEENSMTGGIGSAIAELLADKKSRVTLRRFAVQDKQFIIYGSRDWFHRINGLSVDGLIQHLTQELK